MPAKKVEKRIPAYWQIGIIFPNGQKIIKQRCLLEEVFETYFLQLEKYLNKNLSAEELFQKYKDTYSKGFKVQINYIDSWGHKWVGKHAWPKERLFIEYLNKKINND